MLAKLTTNQILGCLFWDYNNLIENKLKQIMKINSKSIDQILKDEIEKK